MELKTVAEAKIENLHNITDQTKYEAIAEDMAANGWTGRPLLVIDCGDDYSALTGSHRLEAARKAGIEEIPIAIVDHGSMFVDYDITASDLKDPIYVMSLLVEYDEEAAKLYEDDVDDNVKNIGNW